MDQKEEHVETNVPFSEQAKRKWKSSYCCGCRTGDPLTCAIACLCPCYYHGKQNEKHNGRYQGCAKPCVIHGGIHYSNCCGIALPVMFFSCIPCIGGIVALAISGGWWCFTKALKSIMITKTHRAYIEQSNIGENACISYTKSFVCDICAIAQIQYDIEESNKSGFATADILDQDAITSQPTGSANLPGVDDQVKQAGADVMANAASSAISSQVNSFMTDLRR